MSIKVIVVGAGHGGLVAAIKLAKAGLDVQIVEKNKPENLSWDWRDSCNLKILDEIDIPKPDPSMWVYSESITFISPDEKSTLETDVPIEKRHESIERREFANYLVEYATNSGVKIKFNTEIKEPFIKEGVIVGIKTKDSEIKGDLIIDSAGVDTPIRPQLPETYGMMWNLRRGDKFHTYRAYYDKVTEDSYYKVILAYKNKRGISWINTSNEYADVLIGCIDQFKKGEIKELIEDLRSKFPAIGKELLRGGQVAPIPIRRTAPMIVGPNYALIGDAAWMALPLTGSGIENSLHAGDILAKTVLKVRDTISDKKNKTIKFSTTELWPYQRDYFREVGADMAFIDVVKDFLMTADFDDMNFAFRKRILKDKDIEGATTGEGIKISFFDLMGRFFRGISRLGFLLKLGKDMAKGKKVQKHLLNIPGTYDDVEVKNWIEKAEQFFEPYYEILEE